MNNSELATAIVEAILRKLEQTPAVAWEDDEEREMAKLEAIWAVEPLLHEARIGQQA